MRICHKGCHTLSPSPIYARINTAVPDSAGSRRIKIRDDPCSFWGFRASTVVQRPSRRWQNGSYTDKHGSNTESTRQKHGINTAPTRMIKDRPGQSRQSDGPTRTYTAATRTNTAATRTNTDQHGSDTDRPGPSKTCIKAG